MKDTVARRAAEVAPDTLIVGIDMARWAAHAAVFVTQGGQRVGRLSFPTTRAGFAALREAGGGREPVPGSLQLGRDLGLPAKAGGAGGQELAEGGGGDWGVGALRLAAWQEVEWDVYSTSPHADGLGDWCNDIV